MSLESKIRSLKAHPLIQVLADNGGNPRTLVLIEPLWGVPYNLIAPFATLYMYTQGITDVQIGLILSVTMAVQVLFSFLGGILSDKLGRKFTTMMGDFFGWGLACLVWAVSNNFWLFLAAAILNCFEQINQTAWYCLLIEDARPKDLVGIYTWVNIGGLVAIFFAPLSGLFVRSYSIVPVVRVLYFLFALTMILKTLITFRFCHETKQGKIRRAETRGISVFHMLGESGAVPHFERCCHADLYDRASAPHQCHEISHPAVDRAGVVRRGCLGADLLSCGQTGLCAVVCVYCRCGGSAGESA